MTILPVLGIRMPKKRKDRKAAAISRPQLILNFVFSMLCECGLTIDIRQVVDIGSKLAQLPKNCATPCEKAIITCRPA